MTILSRRRFLVASLLAGAGLVLSWLGSRLAWGDPREIVVAVLRRRLGYLNTSPSSFRIFADEYLDYRAQYRAQLQRLSILAAPFAYFTIYRWLPLEHPLRRLEDSVVSQFLLSTDFFQNGADESRELTYVAFYDPYRSPCRNPFARQVVP